MQYRAIAIVSIIPSVCVSWRCCECINPWVHTGSQPVFHSQSGVEQPFQPVTDPQEKSTLLSREHPRYQQISQAGYPDRSPVFPPQAHPHTNTGCFIPNTADGASNSAYHCGRPQEVLQALSPTPELNFTEFIHDSRYPSTQASRPASAGCGSRTTPPSTGPKGFSLPWNEQRPQHGGPRHHSSPPSPAFGLAPAASQNTIDSVDEFLAMSMPVQSAGEPPPADVPSTPANVPSAPSDGPSSALAREKDIIPHSSTSANPTNKDQNSREETMKYGLTEAELDLLDCSVWEILDVVMVFWQRLSARAACTRTRKALVKLLYRDSCPIIHAILTHGVVKEVVNRSDTSSRQKGLPQMLGECTWTSERMEELIWTMDLERPAISSPRPITASRESPSGDRSSSAQIPGKDISTTSASSFTSGSVTDENSNNGEGKIEKYGLSKADLNLLGFFIYNNLDAFMKWWQILSASAADNGRIIAKLLSSDSCPLIQAILTRGVDKGVVNWVDIAPRQKSLPQSPGECIVILMRRRMRRLTDRILRSRSGVSYRQCYG